jgi:hypothetical protein
MALKLTCRAGHIRTPENTRMESVTQFGKTYLTRRCKICASNRISAYMKAKRRRENPEKYLERDRRITEQ